jgi:peptidoglycan/LPS O-acetylase OafA/YrhL
MEEKMQHTPGMIHPDSSGRPVFGRIPVNRSRRILFATGVLVPVACAAILAMRFAPAPAGPADLVRLLRFMALLKASIVLGASLLVWRRLARPVTHRQFLGYGIALALGALGAVWLWSQWLVVWGVLLFYGGLALLVTVAVRDRDLVHS